MGQGNEGESNQYSMHGNNWLVTHTYLFISIAIHPQLPLIFIFTFSNAHLVSLYSDESCVLYSASLFLEHAFYFIFVFLNQLFPSVVIRSCQLWTMEYIPAASFINYFDVDISSPSAVAMCANLRV